jgi:hypothetical protein
VTFFLIDVYVPYLNTFEGGFRRHDIFIDVFFGYGFVELEWSDFCSVLVCSHGHLYFEKRFDALLVVVQLLERERLVLVGVVHEVDDSGVPLVQKGRHGVEERLQTFHGGGELT